MPVEQLPQLLLVLLAEQGAAAGGAEAGVQDEQEGGCHQDVDDDVDPAGRVHVGDAVGERSDADAAQQGVEELLGEGGAAVRLVRDVDQPGADGAGDEDAAGSDGECESGVGAVADGVELAPADQQRGHEEAGERGGHPVEDVVLVPVLGQREDVEREQGSGEQQVEHPGRPLPASHHHGQEQCERRRDQAGGGQVRREEPAPVVFVDLLAERQGEHGDDVEHREQPQVPDGGRRGAGPQPGAGGGGRGVAGTGLRGDEGRLLYGHG